VCKVPIETYFYTPYGIHSRRSQVLGVKSVSLEETFPRRDRVSLSQRALLLFYKIYENDITQQRRVGAVPYAVSVSRDACKRDGTNEQNVATAAAIAVAGRGDCNAPRLIRPLTNHSVRSV